MRTGGHILVRALFGFAAILFASAAHADDFSEDLTVLWWQVGDLTDPTSLGNVAVEQVNGGGSTTAAAIGVEYARIREVNSGEYLYMLDPGGDGFVLESINVPMTWVADVTKFASGSTEAAFMIELGNWDGSTWYTLAVSEVASYTDLAASLHVATSSAYNPNPALPWVATSYVVPEPTSGMLVLVGAALLALRRRRGALRRG